jgi:hypothetical protein
MHKLYIDLADQGEDFNRWCRQRGVSFQGNEFRGNREALAELITCWCTSGDAAIDQQLLDEIVEIEIPQSRKKASGRAVLPSKRKKGGRA